jgi:hypothetical protein
LDAVLEKEGGNVALDKRVSKPLARSLQKMLLQNATLAAAGGLCPLLLKVGAA